MQLSNCLCHSQGGSYTHLIHEVANILEQYSSDPTRMFRQRAGDLALLESSDKEPEIWPYSNVQTKSRRSGPTRLSRQRAGDLALLESSDKEPEIRPYLNVQTKSRRSGPTRRFRQTAGDLVVLEASDKEPQVLLEGCACAFE